MVNSIPGLSNNPTFASGKNDAMGKDDFLKLMITQLKNQDPMEPMSNEEYAAQLAQFSSLEQLQNMNDTLTQSIDINYQLTQSINNNMSAALIGKDVKLKGTDLSYQGQSKISFGYNLPSDAKEVTVKVLDSAGKVVKTFKDQDLNSGNKVIDWDFTNEDGSTVQKGDYTFEVEATAYNGASLTVDTFRVGKIDSLRFTANGSVIVVNNVEYSLAEVYELLDSGSSGRDGDDGDDSDNNGGRENA